MLKRIAITPVIFSSTLCPVLPTDGPADWLRNEAARINKETAILPWKHAAFRVTAAQLNASRKKAVNDDSLTDEQRAAARKVVYATSTPEPLSSQSAKTITSQMQPCPDLQFV